MRQLNQQTHTHINRKQRSNQPINERICIEYLNSSKQNLPCKECKYSNSHIWFFSVQSNRIKNDIRTLRSPTQFGNAIHQLGRPVSAATSGSAMCMVVVGGVCGWVVILAACLRAIGVESCGYSDPLVKQLYNSKLAHLSNIPKSDWFCWREKEERKRGKME